MSKSFNAKQVDMLTGNRGFAAFVDGLMLRGPITVENIVKRSTAEIARRAATNESVDRKFLTVGGAQSHITFRDKGNKQDAQLQWNVSWDNGKVLMRPTSLHKHANSMPGDLVVKVDKHGKPVKVDKPERAPRNAASKPGTSKPASGTVDSAAAA